MLNVASIRAIRVKNVYVQNLFCKADVSTLAAEDYWSLYLGYFKEKYIDLMEKFSRSDVNEECKYAFDSWIYLIDSINELRESRVKSSTTRDAMFEYFIQQRDNFDNIILSECQLKYDEDLKKWVNVTVYYVYKDIIHHGTIVGKTVSLDDAVKLAKSVSRYKQGEEYQEIGYVIAIDDNNSSYDRGRRIFAGGVPKSRILEVHIDPLDDSVKGEVNDGRRSDET